jgi:hypothetical protein
MHDYAEWKVQHDRITAQSGQFSTQEAHVVAAHQVPQHPLPGGIIVHTKSHQAHRYLPIVATNHGPCIPLWNR